MFLNHPFINDVRIETALLTTALPITTVLSTTVLRIDIVLSITVLCVSFVVFWTAFWISRLPLCRGYTVHFNAPSLEKAVLLKALFE